MMASFRLFGLGFLFLLVSFNSLGFDAIAHPGCDFARRVEQWRASPLQESGIRPEATSFIDSVQSPIRLHLQDGVDPSYAQEILGYAEKTWSTLFQEMGFLPPHPDGELGGDARFDIYIVTDLDPLIGGYASFSGFFSETPRSDAYGYLVINNDIDIRIRRFVVAHEMFHGSQMAYDWWEDISFMEGSATWVVDHVFDDEDIYWRYYEFFNKQPYLASDYISLANPYQYGSGLWVQFLDEYFGDSDGSFIREIWEGSPQDGFDNEPDFLDVIDQKTSSSGGLSGAWRRFGEWRVMVGSRDDGEHFAEAEVWDERMDPYFEGRATSGMQMISGTSYEALGPYSHALFSWQRSGLTRDWYVIDLSQTADQRLAVDIIWQTDVGAVREELGVLEVAGEVSFSGISPAGVVEAIVVVSNLTDGTYDADTSTWDRHSFDYEMSMRPLPQ
jgi:hypothetical protein